MIVAVVVSDHHKIKCDQWYGSTWKRLIPARGQGKAVEKVAFAPCLKTVTFRQAGHRKQEGKV